MNYDPERLRKLRVAVRYLLERDQMEHGYQVRLANHFKVTRQRVNQVVREQKWYLYAKSEGGHDQPVRRYQGS